MSGAPGLVYREDYFADPHGWAAVKELLRDIFGIDIGPLDRFGGPDPTSMPVAWFDESGTCVANLSAFAMPVVTNGRVVRAAGLQSGAVRPEWRGRGLFRALLAHTIERIDAAGYTAAMLYTDKPALYEPHGFVAVPQFVVTGLPPAKVSAHPAPRKLDVTVPEDLGLLRRLLAERRPVSNRFAVTAQAEMFLLNSILLDRVRLDLSGDGRSVFAWRMGGDGAFELLDIVAEDMPPLAAILASLSLAPAQVVVHFPPDRLDWEGMPVAEDTDLVFMVRGAAALLPAEPFRLSPMAEF